MSVDTNGAGGYPAAGMHHQDQTIAARILRLPASERAELLRALTWPQMREYETRWGSLWAHPGQVAPPGDWRVWLIRAGRGFGKTRAGAEWVSEIARTMPGAQIALVGATADDVRQVMIEGPSGLVSIARPGEEVDWRRSAGEVWFGNDAKAFVYSAEAPEKLRGPEHHAAWCDELAKWRYGNAAWDNLMLGMRVGDNPQVVVTTTPRPVALMRRVMAMDGVVETRGRSHDNPHLPANFLAGIEEQYAGTPLAIQEIEGELIEDLAGALWSRGLLAGCRVAVVPPDTLGLVRVVVAVDPPAGTASGNGGDACGIVAVGLCADGIAHVLEDASIAGSSPERWARCVAECAERWGADRVVAEKNNGGEMVRSVLLAADAMLPLTLVHASHGKVTRAEPVAALYHRAKVRHVGLFPALEDELCGLVTGGGYQGPGRSPDRADALVWGLSELMLGRRGAAAVRGL